MSSIPNALGLRDRVRQNGPPEKALPVQGFIFCTAASAKAIRPPELITADIARTYSKFACELEYREPRDDWSPAFAGAADFGRQCLGSAKGGRSARPSQMTLFAYGGHHGVVCRAGPEHEGRGRRVRWQCIRYR